MSFFSLLQDSPPLLITFCSVIGLLTGSFLNVVIHRLPKMMEREWQQQCDELRGETLPVASSTFNLAVPRSACPGCGHAITPLENIPVFSYLFLKGRCSQCHSAISLRYPAIELLTGILSGFTAYHFGYGLPTLAALIFCWALIALAFIDLDTQLLPDSITLPLLWIGLLVNLGQGFTDIHSAVAGAIGGYLILWSVYWCFKLTTGKEGMGYGDFKLLAAMGAWLGWKMLPMIILLSSIAGAVIGTLLIVIAGHKRSVPIPFGPYLACVGLIALFWGSRFNQTFLGIS